jgi:hypothetical protein
MAVRLRLGTGVTWCASAPARPPVATNDTAAKFIGVTNAPPPITCPDVPGVVGSASRAFLDRPASLVE